MNKVFYIIIISLLSVKSFSQVRTDTLIKKLDSLSKKTDSAGGQKITDTRGHLMNQGVRGPARGGMNNDGVLERFSRQDVASADVFLDEPHA